ncbi:hypothetical protein BaRGS_00035618, partial [Batillaria attramentaria]
PCCVFSVSEQPDDGSVQEDRCPLYAGYGNRRPCGSRIHRQVAGTPRNKHLRGCCYACLCSRPASCGLQQVSTKNNVAEEGGGLNVFLSFLITQQ